MYDAPPSFRPRRALNKAALLLLIFVLLPIAQCAKSTYPDEGESIKASFVTVPTSFTDVLVAGGLSNPTLMEIAPDGRFFVSEQGGKLRVIKNGALLSSPFLTVSVNTTGERGLLGIAFDPNFATEKFVYVYYTATSPSIHNRVSRFMVSSTNPDMAAAGSEQVLLDLNNLGSSGFHNGGSIHFGPDGKLYISAGENTISSNAQSLTTLLGKVLRINKDGSIPSDNPFVSKTSGKNQAIWAMGLRNPFTFAFQPGTGRMFINDVGANTFEEINQGLAGANYGWPTTEGPTTDSRFKTPFFAYGHGSGCAIVGGAFYNPVNFRFPSDYAGDYFFADYCGGWIKRIDVTTKAVSSFATGIDHPTDVKVGVDGALYYLARGSGAVRKASFNNTQAPAIVQQPASATVGLDDTATFTVVASGATPLAFQWQRDGVDIAGATGATFSFGPVTLADNGAHFRCVVSNASGTATSNEATLTVLDSHRPSPTILDPPSDTLYVGGQTINWSGTATDPEDGDLPDSAFTWQVDLFHDDGNLHSHPIVQPTTGSKTGSFVTYTQGETSPNVWFRITLTVADSTGLTQQTFVDIHPIKANITLATDPPGLTVNLDGVPATSPKTVTGVVGVMRNIEAVSPQVVGGKTFEFVSWSDGGAQKHDISTPASDTTYTATFRELPTQIFEAESAVFSGPIVSTNHPGFTGTGYLDFQNSSGDFVEWTVNAPSAGSVPLEIRYADGSTSTIKLSIKVNGTTVNSGLSFPSTGAWGNWGVVDFAAVLSAGANKIRATTIGVGQPNVDHLKATLVVSGAPVITQQPASVTVPEGGTANFSVSATGADPLAYQWQRNGVDIAGATGSSFTLGQVSSSDDGALFRCIVSNSEGTATSNDAMLTVGSATQILEAEEALFMGPIVTTKHPGFTGSGYLDFQNSSGDFVEWTVNTASAATIPLQIHYANGSTSTIKLSMMVNGATVNSGLSFPSTGSWETWGVVNFSAPLAAGANKLRATAIGVGQPNVDHLKIN